MAKSAFKRLQNRFTSKRARRRQQADFGGIQPEQIDLTDDQLDTWARVLGGDMALARRVARLKAQFPAGTLPELVSYDWLVRQNLAFDYQVSVNGGRTRSGGSVPDFVIYTGGGDADAWLVQGEYWHGQGNARTRDETALAKIPGQYVNGAAIRRVMQLWENDIYRRRPEVFNLALAGLEIR